jgi:hypothetical protein
LLSQSIGLPCSWACYCFSGPVRRYICIEKDEHYFEVMRNRIESHDPNAVKPKPKPKSKSKKETVSDEHIQLSLFGS